MRKIAAGLFVSLDGVVESPDTWTGPYFNDEVGQHVGSLIAAGDTLLLGRVTYQGFAESFGGQSGGMADTMNNFPKVVVSTTLGRAEWQNSTLIGTNVAAEITRLTAQPGRTINVSGSGKRLFDDNGDQIALKLTESGAFGTGVLHLTYRPTSA